MEKEFIEKRLNDIEVRSAQLFLQRQNIEMEKQQIQIAGMQIENELIKLDGQRELLQSLLGENNNG